MASVRNELALANAQELINVRWNSHVPRVSYSTTGRFVLINPFRKQMTSASRNA
jgi:hypothetical protein